MSATEIMLVSALNPTFVIPPSVYFYTTFKTPLPFQAATSEVDFSLSPGLSRLSNLLAIASPVILKPAFRYYTSLTHGSLATFAKTEGVEATCSTVPKGTPTTAATPASTGSSQGVPGLRRNPPRSVAPRVAAARENTTVRRGRGRSQGGGQRGGGGGRGGHSDGDSNLDDEFRLVGHGAAGSPPPPPPPSPPSSDDEMDDDFDIPYLDNFVTLLLLLGFIYGILKVIGVPTIWKTSVKAIGSSHIVQLPMKLVSGFIRGPSTALQPIHILRRAALRLGLVMERIAKVLGRALSATVRTVSNLIGGVKHVLNSLYTVVVEGWFVTRNYLTQSAISAITGMAVLWYHMMDVVGVAYLGPAARTVERAQVFRQLGVPVQDASEKQLLEVVGEREDTEEVFQEEVVKEEAVEEVEVVKEEAVEEDVVKEEVLQEEAIDGIYASMHCPIAEVTLTLVAVHAELPAEVTVEHQNGVPVTQVESRSGYRVRRARVRKRKNVDVGLGALPVAVGREEPVGEIQSADSRSLAGSMWAS